MDEAALAHAVRADQLGGGGHGLGQGQVVTRAGGGDGFLEAVGVDEHVGHRAVDIGAQLQGQCVVHQHHVLAGFGQGEAAVLAEGAAGTVEVDLFATADLAQAFLGGQGAHRTVAVDALLGDRRFGVADQGHAGAAGGDELDAFLQVVEEGGTGAGDAAGGADAAQHVGVDEVGGHGVQAQRALLGGDAAAFQARLHHAAEAVLVQLAHDAAGEHRDLVGLHAVDDVLPRQTDGADGVGGGDHRHLQAARVEAGVVQLARLEAGGQLAGGLHRQLAVAVHLEVAGAFQGHAHFTVIQDFHVPVGRQRLGELLARGDEADGLAVCGGDGEVLLPVGRVHIQMLLADAAYQGGIEDFGGVTGFDLGQGHDLAVGIDVLAVDHRYQLHHHGEAGQGFLARLGVQGLDHDAAETVVERASPGRVIATKTHNHWKSGHLSETPQKDRLMPAGWLGRGAPRVWAAICGLKRNGPGGMSQAAARMNGMST
ncbi:hypothetical protein FQZ97_712140 [compost metagenome]